MLLFCDGAVVLGSGNNVVCVCWDPVVLVELLVWVALGVATLLVLFVV